MPTFCRHNRFTEKCPICSRAAAAAVPSRTPARRPARNTSADGPGAKRRSPSASRSGGVTVRRLERAVEDGYEHDLVPGIRASADAARLAAELAFAVARLGELESQPPGLYAEAAGAEDREEALWLCFQIAALSPLEDDDPWRAVAAVRVPWATGELPRLEQAETGPRGVARLRDETFAAYRQWAARAGSQVAAIEGEASWSAQRRFERVYDRMSFPGLERAQRFEFLVIAGRLGLVPLDPDALMLNAPASEPTVAAAKRILGIGDPVLLNRRAGELAAACGVSVAALDLALVNWGRPATVPRISAASGAQPDAALQARIETALGVGGDEA